MGLDTRIKNTIDKVFTKYADLTVPVVFNKKTVSGFNFTLNEEVSTTSTINTTGFVTEAKSKVEGRIVSTLTLIVKTTSSDFSGYTTVLIDGKTYSCVLKTGNKYATEFEVIET
jgi:hypothetical protein